MAVNRRQPIARMSIDVQGASQLRRKLQDPNRQLFAEPWQRAMKALGTVAENSLASAAPIRTGATVARLYHRVQAQPVPLWVRVGTRAKRRSQKYPRGYPYPRRVTYDRKSPHYKWWERALKRAHGLMAPILAKTAKEIEAKWRR